MRTAEMPLVRHLPRVSGSRPWKRLMRTKRLRRRAVVTSVIAGNFLVVLIVLAVVLAAHHSGRVAAPLANASAASPATTVNPLDQVSSANIAETMARMTGLPETTAVTNQADSQTTELSLAPISSSVIEKPQVLGATTFASNKDITTYTAANGDTISSIATKFGITSDSIRWSNGLSGDSVNAGAKLLIPPVTGIAYTVQTGDTAASLATKFNADQNKIIAYNDAEINGIHAGELILIPDGSKAAVVVASVSHSSPGSFSGVASYGANGYDFGYCTWWVARLRAAAGNPVPTNLGNASTWAIRAAGMGLSTGTTPRVGAAVITKTSGAGHVAYVTAVNGDGTITISEMNHAGWDVSDTRTIDGSGYSYVY